MIQQRSLVRVVEILAKNLVHGEHMDFVLFEHCPHGLVASDLSFVVGVLEVFGPDVGPYLFDRLRAGQLVRLVAITPSSKMRLTVVSPSRSADRGADSAIGFYPFSGKALHIAVFDLHGTPHSDSLPCLPRQTPSLQHRCRLQT